MKAVRLHQYQQLPKIEEVDEPKITGPLDVIVRIGGAGLCRTDLHIIEGQWIEKSGVTLPYTLGHENAGWVQAIGSAVSNVAVGDTVIVHPLVTCGLCRACRSGNDMHCINSTFPGISVDGGMANFLKTTARAVVKLDSEARSQGHRRACGRGTDSLSRGEEVDPVVVSGDEGGGDRSGRSGSYWHSVSQSLDACPDHRGG